MQCLVRAISIVGYQIYSFSPLFFPFLLLFPPPSASSLPVLSVTVAGPHQKSLDKVTDMDFTVTYHGIVNGEGEIADETRPIMLFNDEFPPFSFSEWLYRFDENGQREICGYEIPPAGMWIDEEVSIKLEDAKGFSTLQAGGSCTKSYSMEFIFPEDEGIGDVYMYRFEGASVNWWEWGNREENANTVITLPSWYSNGIIDPLGNPL